MALILDHFYSAALTECNSLTAIVPMAVSYTHLTLPTKA